MINEALFPAQRRGLNATMRNTTITGLSESQYCELKVRLAMNVRYETGKAALLCSLESGRAI